MRILGIETSCDETAAAVVEVNRGRFSVLSNVVASQTEIHAQYGGIVPEVAARSHITAILPVIKKSLQLTTDLPAQTGNLQLKKPDLIAVTAGPGLISALSVGLETARYLGYAWGVPVVATNHLAGHLYSPLLPAVRNSKHEARNSKQIQNPKSKIQNGFGFRISDFEFPAIALLVSGGHTELVLMKGHGRYKLIGETLDDAAGEAFDKIAKLLGLSYPGGPQLAALAERGNPKAYDFPRGMIGSGDFNFSFSGLKTAVLYFIKTLKHKNIKTKSPDICASVQAAIVDVLVVKTVAAAKKYRVKTVLLGGGVAANKSLRKKLGAAIKKQIPNSSFLIPHSRFCTDNAAMIAAAGYITYKRHGASPLDHLSPDPHLPLE